MDKERIEPSYWFHTEGTRVSQIKSISTVYRQADGGMNVFIEVFIEVEDFDGGYTVSPEWLTLYKPKVGGYILARPDEPVTYLDEEVLFRRYSEVIEGLEEMTGALCGYLVKFKAARVVGCSYEYGPHHRPVQANLTVNQGLVGDNSNCTTLLLVEEDLPRIVVIDGVGVATNHPLVAPTKPIKHFREVQLDYMLLEHLEQEGKWLLLTEAQWRRHRSDAGVKDFVNLLQSWGYIQLVEPK